MTFTAQQVADIHSRIDPDGIAGKVNYNWIATAHKMAFYNGYREEVRGYQNDNFYHGGRRAAKYKAMLDVMEAAYLARFGNVDLLGLAS